MSLKNLRNPFALGLLIAVLVLAKPAMATIVIQSGSIASVGTDFSGGPLNFPPTDPFSSNVFYDFRDLTTTSSGGPLASGGWASISWSLGQTHISASGSSTEGYNGFWNGHNWLYGRGHADFTLTLALDRAYSYSGTVSGNVGGVSNGGGFLAAGTHTISAHTLGKVGGFSGHG